VISPGKLASSRSNIILLVEVLRQFSSDIQLLNATLTNISVILEVQYFNFCIYVLTLVSYPNKLTYI